MKCRNGVGIYYFLTNLMAIYSNSNTIFYISITSKNICYFTEFVLLYCAELIPRTTPRKVSTAVIVPTICSP